MGEFVMWADSLTVIQMYGVMVGVMATVVLVEEIHKRLK